MSRGLHVDASAMRAQVTALQHTLEGRAREAAAALRDAVVETAIEVAHGFADRTFPKGFGFKLAKAQLEFELGTLYATGGRVYKALFDAGERSLARDFYHAYKSGNLGVARNFLRASRTAWASIPVGTLDASLHERSRNPQTGRIEVSMPRQIVPEEDLAFYRSVAIKRLGKTASGWNACAEQLGGNGNKPKWKGTAVHGPDGGHVIEERSDVGLHITLINTRKLARKHLSPGQRAAILRRGRRALNDRLIKGAVTKVTRRRGKAA